ncbi:hypothetical protein [Paenibacillus bovis]|uniref:Uncharacterized protein n=1 Tax=Paenibacillus bovis TaxID=1616788 RepID=A0A172ZI13_9BACL|nr:hypothetical protein [Paenibacillus bovis]ANF97275.1 hypothetical protein AR543_15550 [Paenibacillus bovis]
MDAKLLKALKKLYNYSNYTYDADRKVSIYQTDTLLPAEQELLEQHQWEANELDSFTHESIHEQLIKLQSHPGLSWESVAAAFLAGVGGSFPRGISSLESYHRMIHAYAHPYEQAERFVCCKVCGFHTYSGGWKNLSYLRYVLYLGNTYGSDPVGAWTDLNELTVIQDQQPVHPSAEDIEVFRRLLQLLEEADPEETPGQLEKRLTSLKLIKGTKGIRRGILQSLSTVGVLPNVIVELSPEHWTNQETILNGELQLHNTRGRSDMQMPWAGWHGELRVNSDKLQQIFGYWL